MSTSESTLLCQQLTVYSVRDWLVFTDLAGDESLPCSLWSIVVYNSLGSNKGSRGFQILLRCRFAFVISLLHFILLANLSIRADSIFK